MQLVKLLGYLLKAIVFSPKYLLLLIAIMLIPMQTFFFNAPNKVSVLGLDAIMLVLSSVFFSIACQTLLDAFTILGVDSLPATRSSLFSRLNRLAAVISTAPLLYFLAYCSTRSSDFLWGWEWHALIWSPLLVTFGWRYAPLSSLAVFAVLSHMGLKAHIATTASVLVFLAGFSRFFFNWFDRKLAVHVLYPMGRPVTIVNPIPLLAMVMPLVLLTAYIVPQSLSVLGNCVDIHVSPLSLEFSISWDQEKMAVCPAKLAEPDYYVVTILAALSVYFVTYVLLPLSLAGLRYIDGRLWTLFYLRGSKLTWFIFNLALNVALSLLLYWFSFKILEVSGIGSFKGLLHAFSIIMLIVVVFAPSLEEEEFTSLAFFLFFFSFFATFLSNLKLLDPFLELNGGLVFLASASLSLIIYVSWFRVRAWLEG
ncbi:hypothetical protein [Thermofilum sp.]|uniref:hypothetical protein n=1 Tax=Thermofilum sp. TaxID=1961369 RepID=UPI0025855248|nr:hypothetical protein [Thermofilum sp.]